MPPGVGGVGVGVGGVGVGFGGVGVSTILGAVHFCAAVPLHGHIQMRVPFAVPPLFISRQRPEFGLTIVPLLLIDHFCALDPLQLQS